MSHSSGSSGLAGGEDLVGDLIGVLVVRSERRDGVCIGREAGILVLEIPFDH
jgi:hypothetical protein